MNTTELTTVDPLTYIFAVIVILIIVVAPAFIFASMVRFANLADDGESEEFDITESPDEEDNVIFRG